MAKDSGIQWTTHTFNPWWGCEKVSPACKHCYAESFAKRVGKSVWGGADSERRFFGAQHWNEPIKWNRDALKAGERHRVFCASMADVFEDRRDLDVERAKLWPLIAATPALDWLLLSKRWGSADIANMVPREWADGWPANVWAGATVEDQEQAEKRIPALLRVPAAISFLSMEPLLAPVDLSIYIGAGAGHRGSFMALHHEARHRRPSWIILGGESGARARAIDLGWIRSLRDQARHAGVAVFVKQFGSVSTWGDDDMRAMRQKARRLTFAGTEVSLNDGHGGDPSEWPADLRVREFPRT